MGKAGQELKSSVSTASAATAWNKASGKLAGLVEVWSRIPELSEAISGPQREYLLTGLAGSQRSAAIAALASNGVQSLVITDNCYHADRLYDDLVLLLGDGAVYLFPAHEVYPHEEITQDPEITAERLRALEVLLTGTPAVIVAPVAAILRKLVPPEAFAARTFRLAAGAEYDLEDLALRLSDLGYERVPLVEARGQFSVRGGILDVFPLARPHPIRAEFFGDELDSLREFDEDTQRSLENLESVTIFPARELILLPEERARAVETVKARLAETIARLKAAGADQAHRKLEERIAEHIEKLSAGQFFPGADQYLTFAYGKNATTLLAYLPASATVIVDEPARVREAARQAEEELGDRLAGLLESGGVLAGLEEGFAGWPDLAAGLRQRRLVHLAVLSKRVPGMQLVQGTPVPARTPENFRGRVERLAVEVARWRRENYRVIFSLSTTQRCQNLKNVLFDHGIEVVVAPTIASPPPPGAVVAVDGALETGMDLPTARTIVLTDLEVYGRERRRRHTYRVVDERARISAFTDLKVGDYVVHVNHGIGQYLGVETLVIEGVHKDYLVVRYAGDDKLYVPTDQLNMLQKYIGVEGVAPKLYKLGGADWNRVKARVKESVRDMAQKLLALYAERENAPGHAFSADTVWQQEFEENFPFEETPDQIRATEQIKRDMEKPRPMDRLLCGDVGYGKTEVALRAAFKAVMDAKQVAVLVPTTILAQQHYNTFRERFAGFPVRVEVISRFQTPRKVEEIKAELKRGGVDIVIGTHRLLQKDVEFKDLGFVIIDEEQRFGVAQKERLKELRTNVDVLTLTATPIPRTLHMSLVGARDMSVIETPPEDRYPIRTYVMEYNPEVVREAIMRELGRDGQVYFVYNQVRSIDRMAAHLQELVPEARIAVAHGQMDEGRLEQVMLDFYNGEFDILLCTTIVESGLDIPNVNTMIVYDADRLGLAQLYQLRGRVGRSNRVAYAYLTYRRDKNITPDAEKRLQAIKEFAELGAGFKIAMRDLEIRGAGNILGPQQHGFIAAVGFDLYCRLLEEAVEDLRGKKRVELPEPVLDLDIDAYLPDEYIPDSRQKVDIYKKVVQIDSLDAATDVREEIEDRFGVPPEPVENLLAVARLKVLAKKLGISNITSGRDAIVIRFLEGLQLDQTKILGLARETKGRLLLIPGRMPQLKLAARMKEHPHASLQLLENLLLALASL